MIPWECLDRAEVPGMGDELVFYKRDEEYSIRTGGFELMNSRAHGSEEALSALTLKRLAEPDPKILIGGLGMGYTLSAALKCLNKAGEVHVAELIPAVVRWNRKYLGHLADYPLSDSRVRVFESDVAGIIKKSSDIYDAVLLDVDNGPEGLTRKDNDQLYNMTGLAAAKRALKPSGILAVWSSSPNDAFTKKLEKAGFKVEVRQIHARNSRKGGRHTIWFAFRGVV